MIEIIAGVCMFSVGVGLIQNRSDGTGQLAHHKRSSVRGIYNKAKYLKQRHEMMQWWSDQLSEQERIATERLALEDDLSDILG